MKKLVPFCLLALGVMTFASAFAIPVPEGYHISTFDWAIKDKDYPPNVLGTCAITNVIGVDGNNPKSTLVQQHASPYKWDATCRVGCFGANGTQYTVEVYAYPDNRGDELSLWLTGTVTTDIQAMGNPNLYGGISNSMAAINLPNCTNGWWVIVYQKFNSVVATTGYYWVQKGNADPVIE